MSVFTYAIIILSLRVALLFVCALGCFVTGCICRYEFLFHGTDEIVLGMSKLAFCLSAIFFTFLVVSVANLFDLNNEYLYLFAVVNTLTVIALFILFLLFREMVLKLIKDNSEADK